MSEQKYRIGIDLGGTFIKAGILNEEGVVLGKSKLETEAEKGWQEVTMRLAKAAELACKDASISYEEVSFIGVGCPGTIDTKNGIVRYSNNIAWENVPLASELEKLCNRPVKVANDADCAALGEYKAGSGKGCDHMVFLTIGTGIGSGVILNGSLLGGTELGHTLFQKDGNLCTCGRKGCLEAYVSFPAFVKQAKEQLQDEKISCAEMVFEKAGNGDTKAQMLVEEYVEALSEGIADAMNCYWPDRIILGGGVSGLLEDELVKLTILARKKAFGQCRLKPCNISIASLGNEAGFIGAAFLS